MGRYALGSRTLPALYYPRTQLLPESVMKRSATLLFATALIALRAVSSLAQSAASPTPAQHIQPVAPSHNGVPSHDGWPWSLYAVAPGCPIGLRAQQGTGAGMVVTHGSKDHSSPDRPAQHLHLSLTNTLADRIVGITLTAHGLTATSRLTPASPSAGTISRTLHLDLALDPRANTAADLTFDAFTSVSRIELVAIDYADGSSWHAPAAEPCRVTPERLMLVSSR
jgi:hypothetical protein